jgi:cytochrome b
MTEKVTKLAKGAAVGIAAGIFAVFGLVYLGHAVAWLIWKVLEGGGSDNFWIGFIIVALILFLMGGLAGFLAARFFKRGAPPTPQMAIEEGKLIKETVTSQHPAAVQGPSDMVSAREEARS